METKRARVEIKNEDEGIVVARFATLGVRDKDGDLIEPGAFGKQKVKISAYGHTSWGGALPVGVGETREEGDEAIAELQFFMSTRHGRDHFETIKGLGDLGEWSFGFDIVEEAAPDEDQQQMGIFRVLKKLDVHEVSPVLRGAGVDTRTLAVKCEACAAKEEGAEDGSGAAVGDGDGASGATADAEEDDVKESDQDRASFLRSALQEQFGGDGRRIWIDATFTEESTVVYEVADDEGDDSGLFRVSYELDEDGNVAFGEPEEVRRITTYEPLEDDADRAAGAAGETKEPNIRETVAQATGRMESLSVEMRDW